MYNDLFAEHFFRNDSNFRFLRVFHWATEKKSRNAEHAFDRYGARVSWFHFRIKNIPIELYVLASECFWNAIGKIYN